jgi:predicted negative regulator of RcsB-dependent stress response
VDLLEEGEQWESLKAWFRENGLAIVAGAVIGVLALSGWRWWTARNETQHAAASGAYEKLLARADSGDLEKVMGDLEQFRKDYAGSAYDSPAQLEMARIHVARNELDKAADRLRVVADGAKDEQLRLVAKLRLARVQLAQGKPDEALATLGKGEAGAFASLFAEVRGDALQAKGDAAGALREYEAAKAARGATEQQAADGDLLELKINDLKAAR